VASTHRRTTFCRGDIDAVAKHQHLVVQPQDTWFTILKQLSFYLRNHKDDKEVAGVWDSLDGKSTPPNVFNVHVSYRKLDGKSV
jgi:hypothetical protein